MIHHLSTHQASLVNQSTPGNTAALPQEASADDMPLAINATDETMERLFDMAEVGSVFVQTGADIITESGIGGALSTAAHVGRAGAGVYFGIKGVKDMKQAIAAKDRLGTISATGELAIAAEAGISTARAVASLPAVSKAIGPAASAFMASPALAAVGNCMGYLYAGSELIEGAQLLRNGIKSHDGENIFLGALNIGLGITAGVLFATGGVGAAATLGSLALVEALAYGGKKATQAITRWQHNREEARHPKPVLEKIDPSKVIDSSPEAKV